MNFLPKNFTSPVSFTGEVHQRSLRTYYEKDDYISNSQLSALDALCKGAQFREPPQKVFEFGSAFDCFVTERNKWRPYLYDLKDYHFRQIETMSALLNFVKGEVLHHHSTVFQVEHFEDAFEVCDGLVVKAKCKVDCENVLFKHVYEIKTTTCRTLREFFFKIYNYNYDRAGAWYADIVGAKHYSLIVCNYTNNESEADNFHHEVWQIDFTPQMLELGRSEYRRILLEARSKGLI